MVQVGVITCILLLASSTVASAGDRGDDGSNMLERGTTGSRTIRGLVNLVERDNPRSAEQTQTISESVIQGSSTLTRRNNPESKPFPQKRQVGKAEPKEPAAAAPAAAAPAPPSDPAQTTTTTLGPLASSVSVSLTSSAASALASVSASFQGQLSALSSQSSADVAAASGAVSASASSALASASASASSAVASANAVTDALNASASSAIAAASSSAALSASSAVAAASSSAAASAMSAVVAVQASLSSQASVMMPSATMPTATADVSNNLVQPNSSGSTDDSGVLVVTPSQIAAIVIGTIVGTAIFTLLVVYGVMLCRQKREKKYLEKLRNGNKDNDQIVLHAIDHDDETGRAEGYSSRDEKQRANWSVQSRAAGPAMSRDGPKGPLTSHRPSLPPLPEESPRVSDQFNLYPPGEGTSHGLDFHPMTYGSEQIGPGMPEEPAPVKLSLMKRRSKGGSQRIAVARVGSTSRQGGENAHKPQRSLSSVTPYFSAPISQVSSPFQRPPLDRTPSSDTLPRRRSDVVSPLALNPLPSATTGPRSTSGFTWGSWGPETTSQPPPIPSLNVPAQPVYQPYSPYGNLATRQQYVPDNGQDNISFLLQQQSSSSDLSQRAAQPGGYDDYAGTSSGLGNANQISSDYLSTPQPTRPYNHLSGISANSPYSSTFEVPLASPAFMSPLSPPPKSPLRTVVRLTKSDRELRDQHNVSPVSSDGGGDGSGSNMTHKAAAPLPLRRLSRSSGELGAVGLAQATAGLDLNIGPSGMAFNIDQVVLDPPNATTTTQQADNATARTTTTLGSDRPSRASSLRSTYTNTNPNGGGRFTFLSSNGHTPESSRRSLTPTSPWGGPAAAAPPHHLRKRRSSSLGRIEIPPEQLTAGGIYVGAPGPRFTLFPRTDGGNSRAMPPPVVAPLSPSGLSHGKSRSTGNADYEQRQDGRVGFGLVIR
ncbi:hypothetical protein PFICI_08731 [Pestalotiopsis fici W106-1]|uniref:REJ domain-containing protein n=1 Tax=Pestalotiopsis fici (strain W106-1 / CGMCC3.15140) TaxID=1229662 RepID=W3WYC5_PESFW|nr:uncharacterized protein PFICI_08731 [Pestalotiopsis fici W106-1]ETS78878.1 hypothetical protein PFICI_08731 [Pestalotiopsis fici W106-1]